MAGKVFINYRRDDDPSAAARVRDALAARFGKASLFMDIDSLSAGQRFEEELAKALTACDVLVAIIGPRWMDLLRSKSQMSGPRDFVRDEIALALKRKIVVVPVRVGREDNLPPLPRAKDLPSDIRDLVYYQKHDVVHENFARDITGLAEAIARVRRSRRPKRAFPWVWTSAAASVVLSLSVLVYLLHTTPVIWAPSAQAQTTGSIVAQPNRPASTSSPPITDCDRLAAAIPSLDPSAVAQAVALNNIDHKRAVVACQEAITKYPGVARFHFQLGRAHTAGGELELAAAAYTTALEIDPKYPAAYNGRGFAYSKKQDYDRAIIDFTRAIEIDPKYAASYANRCFAHYSKKDYDRTIADCTAAIEIEPKHDAAHASRGRAYFAKQAYDLAIADYTAAAGLNPKEPTNYYNRGLVFHHNKNDYDRAIADYTVAIGLNPKFDAAYAYRGRAYFAKQDYDHAIADSTVAIGLNAKNHYAYNVRGRAYLAKRDYDLAIADFTLAIGLNPQEAAFYHNRGLSYYNKRDYDRAVADYDQAIRIDPVYTAALTGRGLAHEQAGRREQALGDYRAALAVPAKYENGEWAHRVARERLSQS
jgi:tetratricopeptide (TPR) repeat protein